MGFLRSNFSSILSNWLYLAILSDLDKEPVLICPEFVATARSDIKVFSVSPDLCEMIVSKPLSCASSIDLRVSVNVPI